MRALEELELKRLVMRRTKNGNDLLCLTEEGVRATGLTDVPRRDERLSL